MNLAVTFHDGASVSKSWQLPRQERKVTHPITLLPHHSTKVSCFQPTSLPSQPITTHGLLTGRLYNLTNKGIPSYSLRSLGVGTFEASNRVRSASPSHSSRLATIYTDRDLWVALLHRHVKKRYARYVAPSHPSYSQDEPRLLSQMVVASDLFPHTALKSSELALTLSYIR